MVAYDPFNADSEDPELMSQGSWQEDSSGEARHGDTQELRLELAQKKLALAELAQQAEHHSAQAQARCDRLELSLVHAQAPAAGVQQLLDAAHGTALRQSAQAQSSAQVKPYNFNLLCRKKIATVW